MPFDTMAMAAIADELSSLAGGRIQRIIQPAAESVALAVYAGGQQRWLVLSADARLARVAFAPGKLAKAFPEPSPFVMLLRKHLEDVRIEAISQVPGERVLFIEVVGVRLVTEVMGKHSNVILVEGDRVLGALKIVPPHQSRVRPILPGRPFALPPAQSRDERLFPPGPRLDPHLEKLTLEQTLEAVARRGEDMPVTIGQALLGLLVGTSPFLVSQIALATGTAAESELTAGIVPALAVTAAAYYARYANHDWKPYAFTDRRGKRDFAPYPPLGVNDPRCYGSMSAAIEASVGGNERHDGLAATRDAILAEVDRGRRGTERRLASLQQGLAASAGAERIMDEGRLILAYSYLLEPGAEELVIPDLDARIALDSRLTPAQNAERVFKRYRKLRDAAKRVPALIEEAEREIGRLDDLAAFVRMARSEVELRTLSRDISPAPEPEVKAKKGAARARGPVRLALDGQVVLVGRNARENEDVTFRLAARDDLWLHARERTGAHVILRGGDRGASEEIVRAAASLAAFYSEGRSDSAIDVDVTRPRDVRKIPGGAPGRVTYRNFRTVRVKPSEGEWRPAGR